MSTRADQPLPEREPDQPLPEPLREPEHAPGDQQQGELRPEPQPEVVSEPERRPEPDLPALRAVQLPGDERWQALQSRFVDDPAGAVRGAAQLVDEAVQALHASLAADGPGSDADTERLRTAFVRYRRLHDGLTAG